MSRFRHLLFAISLFGALPLACRAQVPAPPADLHAEGYDRHVELEWPASGSPGVSNYQIYRSSDGQNFELLKTLQASERRYIDWLGDEGQNLTRYYKVRALNGSAEGDFTAADTASTRDFSDEEMLDMVQHYTFRYFWEFAHPASGMARERSNGNPEIVTTGGTGFGVMAMLVATERGWVTRDQAINRMILLVSFLQNADRFHGVFPHWLEGETGNVYPFSQYDDGADLVETAFLMQGLLAARQYFDQNTPLEGAVRDAITNLWEDVEWDWFRKNGGPVLYWHWSPNYGFQLNFALRGFFEAQIVYILAAASPTHPVPGSLYQSGWLSGNYKNGGIYFGLPIYCGANTGGPLFFAHYSYLGFDPRAKHDTVCNYFIRNRNHTLINRAYCIANPENHEGYSAECWGLTASDDPLVGYMAHEATTAGDNGTIAPTAALSSMPYTPAESLAALKYFYREQGENLWGPYGFYDAFNLDQDWFATSYLAIDQGPIVGMIENYRTGLLWQRFMANPEIAPALEAIGFKSDVSGVGESELQGLDIQLMPNPVPAGETFSIAIQSDDKIQQLSLFDLQGQLKADYSIEPNNYLSGYSNSFSIKGLSPGIYFLQVKNTLGHSVSKKIEIL